MDSNPTIAWLADHCRRTAIDEKWLLVEHLRVAQQWKDRLTRSGAWHINLHAKTMRLIVNELAATWLAAATHLPVGRTGLELLVDRVVQELIQRQALRYFHINEAARPALSRLLVRTYNDWRLAGLTLEQIDGQAMEVPAKAQDLSLIFGAIREQLVATKQVDYADCIAGAIEAIQNDKITIASGLVLLQPETFPLARRERDLLQVLQERSAMWYGPETMPPISASSSPKLRLSRQVAAGEVNEIRGVLQHCLATSASATQLDQSELLVADYERYAPVVLECVWQGLADATSNGSTNVGTLENSPLSIDSLPITFAEGIACIYSRPGRLLRSWVRWINSEYLQSKAVQIVREGLLVRPQVAESVGYARLASALRRVPIGFGLDRYQPQIQRELDTARRDAIQLAQRDTDFQGDCGSSTLQALMATLEPLVKLSPPPSASAATWLAAARQLLLEQARAENLLDRYARAKLLDDIDGMIAALGTHSDIGTNVRTWLEQLPTQSRLFSSTPRPGCLHVAPLEQGGASGRSHVFMLGLDDRKFPRKRLVDPILLDAERARISANFITSDQLALHQQAAMDRVLTRMQGVEGAHVVFSYSLLELTDDSECFPSPALTSLLVKAQAVDKPDAIISFVAEPGRPTLSASEAFQRELLTEADHGIRSAKLEQRFPRILQQRLAQRHQVDELYSAYDGWVPQAGADLLASTAARPMSPSRLETLGTCPRKYFFTRALGVSPPDEWDIEPDRWLTALDVGTLLHELFEEFLRELQVTNQTPDPKLHLQRLVDLLESKIARMVERVPVHNPEAFQRQRDELLETCEIFLQKEYEYAQQRHAKTWIMEASLGSLAHSQPHAETEIDTDQPIVIELSNGRKLVLCGRIDRIDRAGRANNPEHFIWDYKTGSDWGYDQAKPIQQGRKLQPLLYTRMLAARFAQLGRNPQSVRSFGYFFPSPRTEGLRYEWTVNELAAGNAVLESMLDLLAAGTFIATNSKDDCKYCDYQNVCGTAEDLVAISNLKTATNENTQLNAWRQLRS